MKKNIPVEFSRIVDLFMSENKIRAHEDCGLLFSEILYRLNMDKISLEDFDILLSGLRDRFINLGTKKEKE